MEPRTTIQFIRQALIQAKQQLRPVSLFLAGWALVYAAVLGPLTGWALGQLVNRSGHLAVSNYDIAAFLLTPSGLVFLMVGGALNLAALYAEQAGLFLIASRVELGSVPNLVGLLWQTFKRLPALARLGLWQLLGFSLLFLPFGAAVALMAFNLLGDHDINFHLATQTTEWRWTVRLAALVLGGYALAGAFLFVRWILAVPYVLLSGEKPLRCIRQSWRTTRGQLWLVARPFIFWWAGWLVVSTATGAAFTVLARWLLDWVGMHPIRAAPLLVALQATAIVGGTVVAFVGGTIHQFLLARLYWRLHPRSAREVEVEPVATLPPASTATTKYRNVALRTGRAHHSVRAAADTVFSERRARSAAP